MGAYILRRLLLMIPTLLGILFVSFAVIQFAPGGPVERIIAQLTGDDVSATARVSASLSLGPSAFGSAALSSARAPSFPNSSRSSSASSASTSRRTSASC